LLVGMCISHLDAPIGRVLHVRLMTLYLSLDITLD